MTVTITQDELRSIMEEIWRSLLGSGLTEADADGGISGKHLVGRVDITGGWEGAVTIDCDAELAGALAAAMFGLEGGDAAPDEIRDALGELANMAGGNIKSLLPEPSQLGLPTVSDHEASQPPAGHEPVHRIAFEVDGKRILLNVFGARDA
ncbi:MAG: chemotaxis protein CheX [Acidimicrobiales bacterium]